MLCALYALDVQKIKIVSVVVFEKKRFEAKVDCNTYMYAYKRP
jgi:hypothetical protein